MDGRSLGWDVCLTFQGSFTPSMEPHIQESQDKSQKEREQGQTFASMGMGGKWWPLGSWNTSLSSNHLAKMKKTDNKWCCRGCEESSPLCTIGGGGVEYKLVATLWRVTGVLVTIKVHVLFDSATPFLEI